jgi:Tol biopolymer transport system component
LAEAYRKLGDSESQKVYERIVRDFADQREAVATARAKLAGDASPAGEFGQKLLWNVAVDPFLGGISPDGRYLIHKSNSWAGLFLRDLVTGRDRVLATEADVPLNDRNVFSPDGKRLVCACWDAATPEIRSYDLSAPGRERRFKFADAIGYVDPHDWSPDGKQIAVEITRGDLGQIQIGLMNPDDGSLRVLESVDWRHSTRLFFSPDSKYLAYDLPAHDGHQRDVFVLAADGSRKIDAVVDPAMDTLMGWAPNGEYLLFASDRTGTNSLWALPFREGKPQGDPQLLKANIGSPYPLRVTSAGALYYGVSLSGRGIFVATIDFDSAHVLVPPALATKYNVGDNRQHRWSSNGKYLAYATGGVPRDRFNILSIVDVQSGQARRLPLLQDYFQFPLWAPDDKSVIVRGTDLKGRGGLFRIDVESGQTLGVTESGGYPIGWSADGEKILLRRVEKFAERHLSSGVERVLLERYGDTTSISHDRRFYSYIAPKDGSKELVLRIVPFDGGESREHSIPSGRWTTWSSDGRYILFGAGSEVWIIPTAGGESKRLDLKWDRDIRFLSVQPGGNKIAFQSSANTGLDQEEGIWVMQNFLPAAKGVK